MEVTATGAPCAPLPTLADVDPRLCRRYESLFLAHLSDADKLAAGFHGNPSLAGAFAATQAAWRFLNNDAVGLPTLAGPLLACARAGVADACDRWTLAVLDWCNLHFNGHAAKERRRPLGGDNDLGYELLTALAVSDRDGAVLAPLCLDLGAADGVHTTRAPAPLATPSALDGLRPVMDYAAAALAPTGRPPVFVVDAEADGVAHYRDWAAAGHRFLVRADEEPTVEYGGATLALGRVADALRAGGAFAFGREVEYHGRAARQYVAEAAVVLARPASRKRVDPATGVARKEKVPGPPLPLRLVVAEVRDDDGAVLARRLLLTNLPADGPDAVDAATVALWYYWRWRIETYHKLLKGAGQQVEQWQQRTPEALARRLAVAAMACTVAWRLARDPSPPAREMRQVLVRLAGRQIERGRGRPDFTEPALLAGLGILIPMLLLLEQHDLAHLRELTRQVLPGLLAPPAGGRAGERDV